MSGFNYDKMLKIVNKSLDKFGSNVTLKQEDSTDVWIKKYDPIESTDYWQNETTQEIVYTQPEISILSTQIKALQGDFTQSELSNGLVLISDKKLYLEPAIEPKKNDIIIKDNVSYKIYNVKTIQPADLILMYEVYVRN